VLVATFLAYSPELDPVGACWRQVKDALCNRLFDSLDEPTVAIVAALDQFSTTKRAANSNAFYRDQASQIHRDGVSNNLLQYDRTSQQSSNAESKSPVSRDARM
jgi:hypothetical protein